MTEEPLNLHVNVLRSPTPGEEAGCERRVMALIDDIEKTCERWGVEFVDSSPLCIEGVLELQAGFDDLRRYVVGRLYTVVREELDRSATQVSIAFWAAHAKFESEEAQKN